MGASAAHFGIWFVVHSCGVSMSHCQRCHVPCSTSTTPADRFPAHTTTLVSFCHCSWSPLCWTVFVQSMNITHYSMSWTSTDIWYLVLMEYLLRCSSVAYIPGSNLFLFILTSYRQASWNVPNQLHLFCLSYTPCPCNEFSPHWTH
jgi:hypothetical protein